MMQSQKKERAKGLPKHNKFSESIFGHLHLDRLMRENPNITTIASESYIMFAHNNTLEWLRQKSPAEKVKTLEWLPENGFQGKAEGDSGSMQSCHST